jgi:hypothetical protein
MWFDNYPFDQGKHILFLRHAERHSFKPGSFGHDTRLTTKGKKDAEKVGKNLGKFQWGEIHSSPLIRCEETALSFMKGAKQELPIRYSKYLGDPGVFVEDPETAGGYFFESSIIDIINDLVSSRPIPGMRSLKEGALLFINYLKTIQLFPCLIITHDIIIALLKSYFFNTPPQIPQFLGGFFIEAGKVL